MPAGGKQRLGISGAHDEHAICICIVLSASHKIGKLKSKAAYRSVRLSSLVINALREWKLLCPKGDLGLVFPNGIGYVESYANLIDRGFGPP